MILATTKYDGETVNSLSVDRKDIMKVGDIVAKFTSSLEYFSQEGAQHKKAIYGKQFIKLINIPIKSNIIGNLFLDWECVRNI